MPRQIFEWTLAPASEESISGKIEAQAARPRYRSAAADGIAVPVMEGGVDAWF